MPTGDYEKELQAYEEDSRTACQYGIDCYQKNPAHRTKYKHPPKKQQKKIKAATDISTGRKRTSSECEDDESNENIQPQLKLKKQEEVSRRVERDSLSPSPSIDGDDDDSNTENKTKLSSKKDSPPVKDSPRSEKDRKNPADESQTTECKDRQDEEKMEEESSDSSSTRPKKIIQKLFLTKMPDDFYEFHHFCESLSSQNPTTALKIVDLELVGPYDVLNGKIKDDFTDEPEKYLRHWRYYYDPPEFQTVLKGNDKDGLHYGYWRDDIDDPPVFVARNSANKNCNVDPVAPNIFAAVNKHIGEKLARANPFEKGPILRLSKSLKVYAKDKSMSLDTENSQMRERARKVVAKTFHGAGIVVPYDKKTQLGYRDLAATDSDLKKILKKIDEAETESDRRSALVSLEEVVRLATIAADESDFGTCLELAHDLFSSGVVHVQRTGLRMFASAYNLLNRQKFSTIAELHAKDRKKGSDLGVS